MNDNEKSSTSDNKGSFWTTLPGILTGVSGFIAAMTALIAALPGLIVALKDVGIIGDKKIDPKPPVSSVTPSPSFYIDPTKPFLIQLGSDPTPTSAGVEIDRVKKLAARSNLRVDQFKKENWYVTTVGFFSSREEAADFRSIVLKEIPFFQSTNPEIQNIREWCPSNISVGTYLECRN